MEIIFSIYPEGAIRSLFRLKPYQGQDISKAKIFILGLDANWNTALEEHLEFFKLIEEYLQDGVAFWKKYNAHHPFLLPSYPFDRRKGGVRYHSSFSKMGLDSTYAEYISFVELLNVPTTGSSSQKKEEYFDLIDKNYLESLLEEIFKPSTVEKMVIISPSVLKKLGQIFKKFNISVPNLDTKAEFSPSDLGIKILPKIENTTVVYAYHFSASIKETYAFHARLGQIIKSFIKS